MAADHRFRSITEIWLEGDHYKWRAMRANGIPEQYCSGDASDFDKFEAWARTVPETLGNPLYHWTAMELQAAVRHRPAAERGDGARRLRARQRQAEAGRLHGARAPRAVEGRGRVQHRRPRRLARIAQAAREPQGSRDPGLPDLAAGQGRHGRGPRGLDGLGREARDGLRSLDRHLGGAARGAREAPRLLPRPRLPRLRPRPRASRRRALHGRRGAGAVRPAARGPGTRRGRGPRLPLGAAPPPGAPRPRARLGAAVPRGRDAQQQHPHAPPARPRHRLRLGRRLRAGAARSRASSTAWTRATSWRAPSSTT